MQPPTRTELNLHSAVYIQMVLWRSLYMLISTFEYKPKAHIHTSSQGSLNMSCSQSHSRSFKKWVRMELPILMFLYFELSSLHVDICPHTSADGSAHSCRQHKSIPTDHPVVISSFFSGAKASRFKGSL